MKNLLLAATAILALAATTPALAADGANAAKPAHAKRAGHERHPEIRRAQHALANALTALDKANHDFGGHRAKAMELIKQAQAELNAALAYDAQHDKK
ncbi:MAG TPA: hypothetical protein V6D47_05895 [Oscillatoriaceae cyanobacterium]